MTRDTSALCPACFKDTQPSPLCTACGADASIRRPASVLPLWTSIYSEGRYLIGHVLGQGGFGVTYTAWDETLMQRVAIKELFPRTSVARKTDGLTIEPGTDAEVVAFEEARQKFLEEARLLARPSLKQHPGIITVENFFETYGTAYLVMEYLEGQTLEAYVDSQEGRLPYEVVAAMMDMVLEALRAVHSETLPDGSAMVHRDIKPQNLYITDTGQVKLLDFGAARFAGGQSDRSATAIGTEGYAALEQYTRKTQGPWTDVYAAGATWYHMVTGRKPEEAFLRSSEDQDPLVPPSELDISVAPHIEAAWLRALAIRPQDRWADVEALQAALAGSQEAGVTPDVLREIAPLPVGPHMETPLSPVGEPVKIPAEASPAVPIDVDVVSQGKASGGKRIYIWGGLGLLGAILAYVIGLFVFGNTAPIAVDDEAEVVFGEAVTINVLANDSDTDGDVVSITWADDGIYGTTIVDEDGMVTYYTAEEDYVGTDQFTYYISDGAEGEASGTVSITVTRPDLIRNSIDMEFVLIPAGFFEMGSEDADNEQPVHTVRITHPFYLGKYEVTQAQWDAVMETNPSHFIDPDRPVESVSLEEVQTFISLLNEGEDGDRYRLPTEAEWEYACRAGTTDDYAGDLDEMGWYGSNSEDETHPVGRKQPNAWGIYDMHGNVWEWCADWYDADYYKSDPPQDDPPGSASGTARSLRGGSWYETPENCTSANRGRFDVTGSDIDLGFRLVRTTN